MNLKEKENITDSLGALSLVNESGEIVAMHRLWEEQTAVLVYVRHFG